MEKFCPITYRTINEQAARINGLFTALVLGLYLMTQSVPLLIFLGIEFVLRGFVNSRYSVFSLISNYIAETTSERKMMNAGPKIFAAQLGGVMSISIILFLISGFNLVSNIIAGVLLLFSLLESVLGICVACKLYPFLRRTAI